VQLFQPLSVYPGETTKKEYEMSLNSSVVVETRHQPGCLLQVLWFAFIGVWLGQVWMVVAWILMVTIIGIPLGVAMLNMIPKVVALREPTRQVRIYRRPDGNIMEQSIETTQVPMLLRALYFIFIGWWFSALWMEAAYALCATVIGLPIGFWMFDRVPAVLTLRRE
jgi:uncharacterized membrane protein YccF (DUF307 family)